MAIAGRLEPHPLVVGAAAAAQVDGRAAAVSELAEAAASRAVAKRSEVKPSKRGGAQDMAQQGPMPELTDKQLDDFSAERGRRPYQLVAGYLGGCREDRDRSDRPPSQVLFLDAKLSRWLLVQLEDIVVFNRVDDDSAAFGLLDVLWLKPDARVVAGDESDVVAQSYLTGPFVRVDEIGMTVGGSTYPRQGGGLLLEAVTPGCCGKTRRK